MSKYNKILNRHISWLQDSGYDEAKLNCDELPGMLYGRLKSSLNDIIRQTIWSDHPETFDVEMTAYFGKPRDCVSFTFNYQFDPNEAELTLQKMTAKFDNDILTYDIANEKNNIPKPDLVYNSLLLEGKKHLLRRIDEAKHQPTRRKRPN